MEFDPEKCLHCPLIEHMDKEIEQASSDELADARKNFKSTLLTECQDGPYFSVGQKRWPFSGMVEIVRCQTPRAAYLDKKHTESVSDNT